MIKIADRQKKQEHVDMCMCPTDGV